MLSQKRERCPGEGCAVSSAAGAPMMWCGVCGDMLGVLCLQCATVGLQAKENAWAI